jgi:hypothetical protein
MLGPEADYASECISNIIWLRALIGLLRLQVVVAVQVTHQACQLHTFYLSLAYILTFFMWQPVVRYLKHFRRPVSQDHLPPVMQIAVR